MDHVEVLAGLSRLRSEHPSQNAARDIIDAAITALSTKPEGEAVATYMGRRLTPEGTKEFWGWLAEGVEDLPPATKLYLYPPRSHGSGEAVVLAEGWYHFRPGENGDPDDYDIYDKTSCPKKPCPECVPVLIVRDDDESRPPRSHGVVVDEALIDKVGRAFGAANGLLWDEQSIRAALVAAIGEGSDG